MPKIKRHLQSYIKNTVKNVKIKTLRGRALKRLKREVESDLLAHMMDGKPIIYTDADGYRYTREGSDYVSLNE